MSLADAAFFLALLTTALTAGLFYNWTFAIIPGLRQMSDENYLAAMQTFNRVILNPFFFFTFLGANLFLIASCYLEITAGNFPTAWFIVGASLLYVLGVMAVSIVGNVPMNNHLDALDLSTMSPEAMQAARRSYEGPWNRLNAVRTASSVAATILLVYTFII